MQLSNDHSVNLIIIVVASLVAVSKPSTYSALILTGTRYSMW